MKMYILMNRVIVAHLNISSIRNKIDKLADIVKDKIDILCVTEIKLDESFMSSDFNIIGFSPPYRLGRNGNGGGIMVRIDIPSKELNLLNIPRGNGCIFVEINVYKKKWLVGNLYNPCKKSNVQPNKFPREMFGSLHTLI